MMFNLPRDTDAIFEQLFEIYPKKRKGTRRMALPAWRSAIKREEPEVILAGAKAYAASDPGEYAQGLPAWLNQDKWAWDYAPAESKRDKAVMKARYFDLRARYKKEYHDFMGEALITEMKELEAMLS